MLSFKQVEAVFMERFGISEDRTIAFRGRLQHLQRLGFPDGVNTGKGKKAEYHWRQMIQLMTALDLIDLGLTPDAAGQLVRQNTHTLLAGVHEVVSGLIDQQELVQAIEHIRCLDDHRRIAVASYGALTVSQGDKGPAGYVTVFTLQTIAKTFNDDPSIEPAAAYLELGSRLMLLAHIISDTADGGNWEATASGLVDWAENFARTDSERPE